MAVSGVYAIRNTRTGAMYVGSTTHLPTRWRHHQSYLTRGRHWNSRLQGAWNQDGPEAFSVDLIEEIVPPDHAALDDAEAHHFARLQAEGVPLYSSKYYPRSRGWYLGMALPPIIANADWDDVQIARWLGLSPVTIRTWVECGLIERTTWQDLPDHDERCPECLHQLVSHVPDGDATLCVLQVGHDCARRLLTCDCVQVTPTQLMAEPPED